MSDLQEVAFWFKEAATKQNRKEVADLVMSGLDLEAVRRMDRNYPAWCVTIESIWKGSLTNQAPTYLRRVERATADLLSLGPRLPPIIQKDAAFVLRDAQELLGSGQSRTNFVYAFRSNRPGVRVGKTDRGDARLRSHYLNLGSIDPVALFWPIGGSSPRELESLILRDLEGFRDDQNQDWHLVNDDLVYRVAFNHGATLLVGSEDIWKKARRAS